METKSEILTGDCRLLLRFLEDNSIDSIVTDPPYELGFMGKKWDASGIAYDQKVWEECLRVLKPGGHLLAFSGSRTYHRMVCAIEDNGFEIRDQIMWVYGSGFPKSLDVSKAIDKRAGVEREVVGERAGGAGKLMEERPWNQADDYEKNITITAPATPEARQWQGWGTALKPAHEPICVARKPLIGTVAENILEHGTGAINVDGCRVGTETTTTTRNGNSRAHGRFPANLIHDGSEEVLAGFQDRQGFSGGGENGAGFQSNYVGGEKHRRNIPAQTFNDSGSAARFFYCAKASKRDRDEGCEGMEEKANRINAPRECEEENFSSSHKNHHPTVKPSSLMRYLCRLVTPPGGLVLDPFTGSGSTGKAAVLEGFRFIGCELSQEYAAIAEARISHALKTTKQLELI